MALRFLQSQIAFQAAGQYCQVVNWWRVDDPGSEPLFSLARNLAQGMSAPDVGDAYLTALTAILSEDTFVSSVKARVVSPTPGAAFIDAFAAADWPGQFGGELAAQQVSTYIKWMTVGDAGAHGGNFYPGVSEEALDANRFTDPFKTEVTAFATAHIAGFEKEGYEFEPVLNYHAGEVDQEFKLIVAGQISTTAGTQRRRLTPV